MGRVSGLLVAQTSEYQLEQCFQLSAVPLRFQFFFVIPRKHRSHNCKTLACQGVKRSRFIVQTILFQAHLANSLSQDPSLVQDLCSTSGPQLLVCSALTVQGAPACHLQRFFQHNAFLLRVWRPMMLVEWKRVVDVDTPLAFSLTVMLSDVHADHCHCHPACHTS